MNNAIKKLFFLTMKLNTSLHLVYIPTSENEADAPSRRLTNMDCKLHPDIWERVQREFGGPQGHTCDLMALDSNAMTDQEGVLLTHFIPHPSPQSCGVNIFAQDLSSGAPFLKHPYVFPPITLVGPVLRFLKVHRRPCTFVVLDVYPKKYWWPLIQSCASKSCRLRNYGPCWLDTKAHSRSPQSCGCFCTIVCSTCPLCFFRVAEHKQFKAFYLCFPLRHTCEKIASRMTFFLFNWGEN